MKYRRLILKTVNSKMSDSSKEGEIDFWETLTSSQKDEILLGIDEIEKGQTIDYEDFIKKHRL